MSSSPTASIPRKTTIAAPTSAPNELKSTACSESHAVSDCMRYILELEDGGLTGAREISLDGRMTLDVGGALDASVQQGSRESAASAKLSKFSPWRKPFDAGRPQWPRA